MSDKITMEVPLALQQLINANNERLKAYQTDLMQQVQDANIQMMQILKLDPTQGWRLDANRMVYVKLENTTED
jgi:hypothetical protein